MPWQQQQVFGEAPEMVAEGLEEHVGMTAIVAVSRTRMEERVAGHQESRLTAAYQADVAHRVPWGVEDIEVALAYIKASYEVDSPHLSIDIPDGIGVNKNGRSSKLLQCSIAVGVVMVGVGVEDGFDSPAASLRFLNKRCRFPWIDGQGASGDRTCEEVVDVSEAISSFVCEKQHDGNVACLNAVG